MTSTLHDAAKRAEIIAALRDFADLIETDPTVPTPNDIDAWAHLHRSQGTQAERFAAVHDFAEAHGVAVTEDWKGERKTHKRFGLIELHVFGYADERPEDRIVTRADDPALSAA